MTLPKGKSSGLKYTAVVVLRLYVSGDAPNSLQAIANLEAICDQHLKGGHKIEVVDVLKYPLRAMAQGVRVTPTLAKLSPGPIANVVGNLNDKRKVLVALGLARKLRSAQ
ncbi:MAG TPA: circadian clock KaiB family protein [Steroidobacteraceae bacterium]